MFDFDELDHYSLLGLSRNAATDDIKRAYRREMSKYHPDRFANASEAEQQYASARSQRINQAYSVLSDFIARNQYNRQVPAQSIRPAHRAAAAPPAEPAGRDHQAELYDQAQAHLNAGRPLQALAALRQLQQINPFYRDSSALLARVKQDLERQRPARAAIPQRLLIAAGLGGAAILAAALFLAFGRSDQTIAIGSSTTPVSTVAIAASATALATPTEQSTAVKSIEPPVATPTATRITTSLPEPTAAARPSPTALPAPTNTALPSATQVVQGKLVLRDNFSSRSWAQAADPGWSVGYENNRYRIEAAPNYGPIWSYRSNIDGNRSYSVTVQVSNGEAGILLHFIDNDTYLIYLIDPAQGSYRVSQARNGGDKTISSGTSSAILLGADASNQIEARLIDNQLILFANGQNLESIAIDTIPQSARYGLVALAGTQTAVALFDNFEIRSFP